MGRVAVYITLRYCIFGPRQLRQQQPLFSFTLHFLFLHEEHLPFWFRVSHLVTTPPALGDLHDAALIASRICRPLITQALYFCILWYFSISNLYGNISVYFGVDSEWHRQYFCMTSLVGYASNLLANNTTQPTVGKHAKIYVATWFCHLMQQVLVFGCVVTALHLCSSLVTQGSVQMFDC